MKHVELFAIFIAAFFVSLSESSSHDRKKVPKTECEKNGWQCTTAGLADCTYKRTLDKDCHKVHGLAFCCVPKKGKKENKKLKRAVDEFDSEEDATYLRSPVYGGDSVEDIDLKWNRQQTPPTNRRSNDEIQIDPVDDGFDHSVTTDPFGYDVYEEDSPN